MGSFPGRVARARTSHRPSSDQKAQRHQTPGRQPCVLHPGSLNASPGWLESFDKCHSSQLANFEHVYILALPARANSLLATAILTHRSEEHTSELQSRENLVC